MNGKNFSASLAKSRQFGNDKSLRNLVNELSGLDIAERENRLRMKLLLSMNGGSLNKELYNADVKVVSAGRN